MDTGDWIGVGISVIGIFVGAGLTIWTVVYQTRSSETRLRTEITDAVSGSEARMRAENREAHAAIGENINRIEHEIRSDLGTRIDGVESSLRNDLGGRIDALARRDRQRAAREALETLMNDGG